MPGREEARARLGLRPDAFVVATAGFATRAKRFDWLLAALDRAVAEGAPILWVHAGEERPEEFALSAALAARPALRAHGARITGWLPEAALDEHIAAADVLVNLRFPSSGEGSGSLARALAAGTGCIVSRTAGYAELPPDAVLHIPPAGAVPALAAALAALAQDPATARAVGAAGRRFALREMALPKVAAAYRAVVEESLDRPVAAVEEASDGPPPLIVLPAGPGLRAVEVEEALTGVEASACRLLLAAPDLDALAGLTLDRPGLVAELLPPFATLRALRVQPGPGNPGLLLELKLAGRWAR
jgi:hypothetical protein